MKLLLKKRVFHVGVAAVAKMRHRATSFEGAGLSVSEHPAAWRMIAKLGGRLFVMRRKDGQPGRFLAMGGRSAPALLRLAVDARYIVPAVLYRAWYYDSEEDEERYFTYQSKSEAESEIEEAENGRVEAVRSYVATRALRARWAKDFSDPLSDSVAIDIAILYALESADRTLDGAWWQERLEPYRLSAPRGVIFPSRLERWTQTEIPWSEAPTETWQ